MKLFGIELTFGRKHDDSSAERPEPDAARAAEELTLTIRMGASGSLDMRCRPGRHYVYRHRSPNGKVFYVGKGTGNRAWSKDRPPEHVQYVERFCGGKYDVEIVRGGVSEEDALTLEDLLMQQHGDTIVNRQNMHAPLASDRLMAYSAAQRAESEAMQRARAARDSGKIDEAVAAFEEAYRQALLTRDYSDYQQGARRLVELPFPAPTAIAHEYTVMLAKAERHAELIAFVDGFERDWGPNFTVQAQQAVLKRRERSRRKLADGERIE